MTIISRGFIFFFFDKGKIEEMKNRKKKEKQKKVRKERQNGKPKFDLKAVLKPLLALDT